MSYTAAMACCPSDGGGAAGSRTIRSWLIWMALWFVVVGGVEAQSAEWLSSDVRIVELAPNVWLHQSFVDYPPYGRVSANGIVVRVGDRVLLVDTAWNDTQTDLLISWAEETTGQPVTDCVVTHYHSDNLGGLPAVHARGIASHGLDLTGRICEERGIIGPQVLSASPAELLPGCVLYYPGPGHTEDNAVVYVSEYRLLFGGCLVRAAGATNLGNLEDAVPDAWAASVRTLMAHFPEATIIVPGHGAPGGRELLDHTLQLVRSR